MDAETAYPIVERIITQGFLTAELRIDGSYVVIKSMTDRESSMLGMYRDAKDPVADLSCKLAFCTFSIDGESMLDARSEAVPALMGMYRRSPVSLVSSLNAAVKFLSGHYYDVLRFLEGFCYTERSRYLWRVYKEDGLLSFPGARVAGLNAVQENWALVNRQLDEEHEYAKQFNLSLMVASSLNYKGARVISRNYDKQRDELESLRAEIRKWGYDKKRRDEEKRAAEWTMPIRSREDIVRELYRQMRGEKDKHDLFIDKWMERQRSRAEEMKRRAEERARAFREGMRVDPASLDEEDSRQATPEEIEALSSAPKSHVVRYMSAYEGYEKDEKDDRFMKKVSTRVIR